MCSPRWLSAACKVAGLRRGSDAQTSHHSVAQSSNRRRDPLGSTQAPRSLDPASWKLWLQDLALDSLETSAGIVGGMV
jgi:hypothetical protein